MKNLQLFETYKSNKELQQLSNEIIKIVAEITIENNISKEVVLNMGEVDISNYDTLKDFIKSYKNLKVIFTNKDMGKGTQGMFNPNPIHMSIKIKISEDILESEDETMLYTKLFIKYNSVLLHELQHAYDDYRSYGKALKIPKGYIKDTQIIKDIMKDTELTEMEKKYINKNHNQYLNFPHEINARFIQAIADISFIDVDFIDGHVKKTMLPLREVIDMLKGAFLGWEKLSEKYKRKLIRKVSQFYHFKMEEIKQTK